MSNKYHHIAIALGGVCQSASLVPQLSSKGQCDQPLYLTAINSIFNTSPSSIEDVYDGVENIRSGLQILSKLLAANNQDQIETMKYAFSVLGITSKLIKNPQALDKISKRLERIQIPYSTFDKTTIIEHQDELSYSLAGIYSDIISPLGTKIRVTGKVEYLQNSLVQAKVRASLLGAVRSAMLWYQVGGNRLQFLYGRRSIVNAANNILAQINRRAND